jgi:hypothetical protein
MITMIVDPPAAVARQRLIANRRNSARVNLIDAEFDHLLRGWDPPAAEESPPVFHHGVKPDDWCSEQSNALGQCESGI